MDGEGEREADGATTTRTILDESLPLVPMAFVCTGAHRGRKRVRRKGRRKGRRRGRQTWRREERRRDGKRKNIVALSEDTELGNAGMIRDEHCNERAVRLDDIDLCVKMNRGSCG